MRGHEEEGKTPDIHEIAACICGILDESGSTALKAYISYKKAQNTGRAGLCFLCPLRLMSYLRSGRVRRTLIQPAVDDHLHFDTSILLPAGRRRIVGNGFGLTVTHRRDKTT